MITLTIKITQRPEGIAYTFEPCDQKSATISEKIIGNLFLCAIEEAMKSSATVLQCGLQTVKIDDPRNQK